MQETDRVMEDMFDVIAAHTPVGWLELVMNHNSFSQTVENIFTLSFLVRVAHIQQQPCALLSLRPIKNSKLFASKHQCITTAG